MPDMLFISILSNFKKFKMFNILILIIFIFWTFQIINILIIIKLYRRFFFKLIFIILRKVIHIFIHFGFIFYWGIWIYILLIYLKAHMLLIYIYFGNFFIKRDNKNYLYKNITYFDFI
jgi:hypothetical protein